MSKRRLPIPLILLIPIVLLAIVIIAGVYRFSMTDEEIGQKQGWITSKPDEVMLNLFSYKNGKPLKLILPDSNLTVALTHFVGSGTNRRAVGEFNHDEERGELAYDYFQTAMLNFHEPTDNMIYVAPYTVSNQGSGTFHYLGLFEVYQDEQRIQQLDTFFLGDRLKNVTVIPYEPFDVTNSVEVTYWVHGEQQAMAEEPSKEMKITLPLTPTHFKK